MERILIIGTVFVRKSGCFEKGLFARKNFAGKAKALFQRMDAFKREVASKDSSII